ncbi:heme exporter protein CcmD [Congregibacter sp.]|jgi:heme exporter protein D|uniref:heme exporter protein CcmD n=1 Tax=Congregibacter sp. TaxID=2744308 RepID=UPI0039E709C0
MYFDSFAAALAMDGHGPYVWSAYALTLVVIALLILLPIVRKRRLLRELRGEHRRNRQAESRSSVESS